MSKAAGPRIVVAGRYNKAVVGVIAKGLTAHNRAAIGRWPRRVMTVTARGKDGKILGGLHGFISWGWLYVAMFWIEAKQRGRDAGRACLAAAEAEAKRRGCHGVRLDTGSFQAPGFYRKQGYKLFGKLAGFPPGQTHWWFYKRLSPSKPMAGIKLKPRRKFTKSKTAR